MATPAINSLGGANRSWNTWGYFLSRETQVRNVFRNIAYPFDSYTFLATWQRQDTNGATAPKLDTTQNQAKSNY